MISAIVMTIASQAIPTPTRSVLTYEVATLSVVHSMVDCSRLGRPSYGCRGKGHSVELLWSSLGGPLHVRVLDDGFSLRLWATARQENKSCSGGLGYITYKVLGSEKIWEQVEHKLQQLADQCGLTFEGSYTPIDEYRSAMLHIQEATGIMRSIAADAFGSIANRCLEEDDFTLEDFQAGRMPPPHPSRECVRYQDPKL